MQFFENLADDEWEWYIGKLYTNIFMECFSINNINSVVELAPGFRYKIAYALKDIKFCGMIYVIDENKNVCEYIKDKYSKILPMATVVVINESFENSIKHLPKQIDLFVSNHSLDDMIISKYFTYTKNNQTSQNDFVLAWDSLAKNPKIYNHIIKGVYNSFIKFFNKISIKYVAIAQYESNLYFKNKTNNIKKITQKCFEKVKYLVDEDKNKIKLALNYYPFGEDKRYLGKELLSNTQNAKNWIVGEVKRQ